MAAHFAFSIGAETKGIAQQLPGTAPLTLQGDISELMIAGVDRFLLRETDAALALRGAHWRRDVSSQSAYADSVAPNRERLAKLLGLRDARVGFEDLELVSTSRQPPLVGKGEGFEAYAIRWPVFDGVSGEGLWLEPTDRVPLASVVVLPDCEQTPEALVGLEPGVPATSQIARRLAETGCRVIIPTLINRGRELSVIADGRRRSTASHREILYRAAYQMGRHLIGYEVQKVLAAIDWLARGAAGNRIGVVGYGEGGMLALYASALDLRIRATGVSGYFDSRQDLWREPIDRNVFGLLREFGDAEISSLILPRALVVEACIAPELTIAPGNDGGPGRLTTPNVASVRKEITRARELVANLKVDEQLELVVSGDGSGEFGSNLFLQAWLQQLGVEEKLRVVGSAPVVLRLKSDVAPRLARQFKELAAFSQRHVDEGPYVRSQFVTKMNRTAGVEKFVESTESYRAYFGGEIIGVFDRRLEPASPRTRLIYDEREFRGYEVILDVYPDVFCYGIILVPKDLQAGERRPVVVCQHGLNGRAEHTVVGDMTSYRDFSAHLARRGFVVFAPQHLYRGENFRTLQRKANPIKRSLFSIMTAQHQQLLDWLGGLDFVDPKRIAFYGISYGGKSAMRIPALLQGYCLSICSSDFSDWIWRTVSNRFEGGYLAHREYEIFEFDLGSTFNYAEMAALICPRPFMAEDFHSMGWHEEYSVGEFGRVRLLYDNLKIGERLRWAHFGASRAAATYTRRETFDFLHEQLKWPAPR